MWLASFTVLLGPGLIVLMCALCAMPSGAAGNFLCPAATMSANAFRTVMEIDALGTFNVTKAVFDASMQEHGGCVLNITATLHYKGDLLQAHAGAAKAAIGTQPQVDSSCAAAPHTLALLFLQMG